MSGLIGSRLLEGPEEGKGGVRLCDPDVPPACGGARVAVQPERRLQALPIEAKIPLAQVANRSEDCNVLPAELGQAVVGDAMSDVNSPLRNPMIPTLEAINTVGWPRIAGAFFGALSLLGFYLFAFLARNDQSIVCHVWSLLTPVFAFGAALSVGFFGGSAAASGQLGDGAVGRAFKWSAGGGVAAFVIAFGLFKVAGPSTEACAKINEAAIAYHDSVLNFRNIPVKAQLFMEDTLWSKEITQINSGASTNKTASILLRPIDGSGKLTISLPEGECSLIVRAVTDPAFKDVIGRFDKYKIVPYSADNLSQFAYNWQPKGAKASAHSCFSYDNQINVVEELAVSPQHNKMFIGRQLQAAFENDGREAFGGKFSNPSFALITKAYAGAPLPYGALKTLFQSDDIKIKVTARRYIEQNFDTYSIAAIKDLLNQSLGPPVVIEYLLYGLIAGIDAKNSISDAGSRSRSVTEPAIHGWQ